MKGRPPPPTDRDSSKKLFMSFDPKAKTTKHKEKTKNQQKKQQKPKKQ
jgi:hypothetical protein